MQHGRADRWYTGGGGVVWGQFRRTSDFGAGPSDAGNFNAPPLSKKKKKAALFPLDPGPQTSSTTTNFPLPSAQDGPTRRTDGLPTDKQRNNTGPPPPGRMHKEQEVPQMEQENFGTKLKNEIVPLRNPPRCFDA